MSDRVRYRLVQDDPGEKPRRVRVVTHFGHEGYFTRFTQGCSGCSYGDGSHGGCHECGYTGKRRVQWFVPFDEPAFQAWLDARWQRRERLVEFFLVRRLSGFPAVDGGGKEA